MKNLAKWAFEQVELHIKSVYGNQLKLIAMHVRETLKMGLETMFKLPYFSSTIIQPFFITRGMLKRRSGINHCTYYSSDFIFSWITR